MEKAVNEFASRFSKFLNAKAAFAFWKGRVALYAVLKSLDLRDGDEVIMPGYTCVMNVNPVKYLGAKPVYVDIEPQTFNINPDLIEAKITPRTKVIIAQHTYGYPCRIDQILDIAAKYNLSVIEDCCLTLGSTYKGKLAGTFGRASYFSFQWNKPFTTGLGGMAVINDPALVEKVKAVLDSAVLPTSKEVFMLAAQLLVYRAFIYPRTTAFAQTVFRKLTKKGAVVGSSSAAEFSPVMAQDFVKGMSRTQARAGLRQLKKLSSNCEHRRKMAQFYDEEFNKLGWPSQRRFDKNVIDPVMVRYPVRIKEKQQALAQAADAGVELGSWFECPLHPIETPLAAYDYIEGMCPEAERASLEVVNLPVHPRVNEKTVLRTVAFIKQFTPVQ